MVAEQVLSAIVRGAEHEYLHELVEDNPIRNAGAVAAQRMLVHRGRDERFELVSDGLND